MYNLPFLFSILIMIRIPVMYLGCTNTEQKDSPEPRDPMHYHVLSKSSFLWQRLEEIVSSHLSNYLFVHTTLNLPTWLPCPLNSISVWDSSGVDIAFPSFLIMASLINYLQCKYWLVLGHHIAWSSKVLPPELKIKLYFVTQFCSAPLCHLCAMPFFAVK